MQAVATAAAQDFANENAARHLATQITNKGAAALYQGLREENRQLERAGTHDRLVALALQDAMLTDLPDSDDVLLAARYIAAASENQVGGDWYDAVVLPRGRITLVIGDVVGHDIQAAAAMGQLRNILRALLLERTHTPSRVLSCLDQALRDLRISAMATSLVLDVEPPENDDPESVATLRWSSAGHLAPMLMQPDGAVILLEETSDVLLGVEPDTTRRDLHCRVPRGATLLLYTDGLVESRTQAPDVGQSHLLNVIHAHQFCDLDGLLDGVIADMVGDRPSDDVAVLAARFHEKRIL